MKFIKTAAKIIIAAGVLLIVFSIYIYSVAEKDKTKNPANTFIGSDFSVSKTTAVPTVTPTPTPTPKPLAKDAFRYIINDGSSQKSFDKTAKENQTVFSILEGLSKTDNLELKYSIKPTTGVFIESIGSIKNGTDNKYWLYYINGALSFEPADKQAVKAGDILEWRFEKSPY